MTDTELIARIDALEIRLMHQETTLDELTRTLLKQETLAAQQADIIKRLETRIRTLTPSSLVRPEEETPPPHY
ncbi:MAG: SlyX family protein [Gammaproteobacteria bacterium]|nr:SlyX family protein [Gammaproteobacteria bacterium]